jgi:hypothetical protein
MSGHDTRILIELAIDGSSDRVFRCHIVGDTAAEIIQVAAIAVKMKATKADFDATFALHPSVAEKTGDHADADGALCKGSGGVGCGIAGRMSEAQSVAQFYDCCSNSISLQVRIAPSGHIIAERNIVSCAGPCQ